MAADDDRRVVGGAAPPLSMWFVATGAVLIVSLLAALFVQARQYALLNHAVQGQDDYLVLNLFQLETEYLRLRERWRQSAPDPATAREQLQLRYDIFVSRIGLLQTDRATRLLGDTPEYGTALRALRDFVDRGDLYLGQGSPVPFSAASLQALLGDLEALDPPVHQMLLAGSHRVAEQVTARNAAIGQHNRVNLALTAFLSLMVGTFGFLALRRMRQLEDSRRAMEAMANRLHDAREQALRASQAKSEFLTSMSHAIRTPFHGMLGMLTLLRESKLDARQHEQLRTAIDSADHLLSLLNDIVDLSKLEAGNLALDVREVDLAALVHEVQRLMRTPASAKGLALTAEVAPSLPPRLLLDGNRLRQVLYNLVANAIRFTDHGSVSLRAGPAPGGATAVPLLDIEVTDTGIGMDADALQRLFERSRLHERGLGRDPARQGTGLGLEIAHRLVQLMGGDITVDSAPARGSVFRVQLPLREAPAPAATSPVPAAAPGAAEPARARHVLVAEDNAVNRLYLAALLERMGHSAHFVENGLEALQAVQEHRFDIVLMDVHMPVMDGIAATEAIRALGGEAATLPVVALTADAFPDTHNRCLVAGMDEVLVKPLGSRELEALFGRRFGAPATAAGREAPAPPAQAAAGPPQGSLPPSGDGLSEARPWGRSAAAGPPQGSLPPSGGGLGEARPWGRSAAAGPPQGSLPPSGGGLGEARPWGRSIGAGKALLDADVLARLVELMPRAEAARLYQALLEQAGDATTRMRQALREADTDELRRISHGMKGAALNLGLHALADAADRLGAAGTAANAAQLALALQRFDETLAATRALCESEPALAA